MKLVCHENIPGTTFKRGDVIHDSVGVALIQEQHELAKHFSQVADDAFPDPPATSASAPAPAPKPAAAAAPPPASSAD